MSSPLHPVAAKGVVALDGCRLFRPAAFEGALDVVTAAPEARGFPTHVNEGLGVCLKMGPAHTVVSDGRALTYPEDSVCVRFPGCVWSSEVAAVGFVSLDFATALLPRGLAYGPMQFVPAWKLPDLRRLAHRVIAEPLPLCREEVLAQLFEALFERGVIAADEMEASSAPASAVYRVRDFLHASVAENPRLDTLASAGGMNKFVLLRQFKRKFGTTPHHYLLSLRVERARSLLAAGDPPIAVAAALGFADQAHFSRHFKRLVGVAPGSFVRLLKTSITLPRPPQ